MRYALPAQVLCLILLPIAGCGSSRLCFWRGAQRDCNQCKPCDSQLRPADTVNLGQPPMFGQPTMIGEPTIEYADPRMMPDNFRAVEPNIESVPSNPDLEDVPIPVPDPAT